MSFMDIIRLLRVKQWYKNLVVFLGIFFAGNFFDTHMLLLTFVAFISLCLISSTNYIINDIVDRKKDRKHPEKKKRPIASGKVSVLMAMIIAIILAVVSFYIAVQLSMWFLVAVIALFVLTTLYTLILKNEVFIDILLISINFVIRAVSGVFAVKVFLSPWLILCPFFFALFLATGKRHADVLLMKDKSKTYKKVLEHYSKEITVTLMVITTAMLIMSYFMYIMSLNNIMILLTLPFVLYCIFRWYQHVFNGENLARHPELAICDVRLVAGAFITVVILFMALY
jgi:4-hydroxybenzoate polyprenyltransferase